MAPQPSLTEQGPHQPLPPNIPPPPAADETGLPSTPVQRLPETPRRHTRRSEPNFDLQTLPGTCWDELEIERQRERQRGREPALETTDTPSLDRVSLREKKTQVSSQRATTARDSKSVPETRQTQQSVQKPGPHSVDSSDNLPGRVPATGRSSVKRGKKNRTVPAKDRLQPGRRGKTALSVGLDNQSPSLNLGPSTPRDPQVNMARRPGRNQVDYVAELKETIHDSLSKLSDIHEKLAPIGQQIVALEEELKAKEGDSSELNHNLITPGVNQDTKRLDDLYRAKVKLTEQETGILHNPPDDLINKMGILNALAPREDTQAPGRGSAASKQRGAKRSGIETETVAVDSPGPSPSDVRSSDQLRRVKGQGQRSSSVASQTPRDTSSRLDEASDASRTGVAERAKMLVLHAEVAYRQSKTTHDSDGERIHCTINGIRKDKGSGRAIYDIKDKDESENLLYTARAEDLLPIPPPNSQLPTFSPGKAVIALYPGTTTFYNAQVIALFAKRDVYSLKFEGEENEKEVKEVERRYVLDTKTK